MSGMRVPRDGLGLGVKPRTAMKPPKLRRGRQRTFVQARLQRLMTLSCPNRKEHFCRVPTTQKLLPRAECWNDAQRRGCRDGLGGDGWSERS